MLLKEKNEMSQTLGDRFLIFNFDPKFKIGIFLAYSPGFWMEDYSYFTTGNS
jgi:hypothetical protein